jgi:hypothetical protein
MQHGEPTVAKRKPAKDEPKAELKFEAKTERVELIASPSWLARQEESADMLGLSLAAFIRMACEKESRRLRGSPDGD